MVILARASSQPLSKPRGVLPALISGPLQARSPPPRAPGRGREGLGGGLRLDTIRPLRPPRCGVRLFLQRADEAGQSFCAAAHQRRVALGHLLQLSGRSGSQCEQTGRHRHGYAARRRSPLHPRGAGPGLAASARTTRSSDPSGPALDRRHDGPASVPVRPPFRPGLRPMRGARRGNPSSGRSATRPPAAAPPVWPEVLASGGRQRLSRSAGVLGRLDLKAGGDIGMRSVRPGRFEGLFVATLGVAVRAMESRAAMTAAGQDRCLCDARPLASRICLGESCLGHCVAGMSQRQPRVHGRLCDVQGRLPDFSAAASVARAPDILVPRLPLQPASVLHLLFFGRSAGDLFGQLHRRLRCHPRSFLLHQPRNAHEPVRFIRRPAP